MPQVQPKSYLGVIGDLSHKCYQRLHQVLPSGLSLATVLSSAPPGHRDTKPLAASVRLRRPLSRLRRYRCGNCTFVTIQVQGNHLARRPRDRPARWRATALAAHRKSLLVSWDGRTMPWRLAPACTVK